MSDRIERIAKLFPEWVWDVPDSIWIAALILAVGLLNYIRLRMVYSELERFDANQKIIWQQLQQNQNDLNEKFVKLLMHLRLEIKRVGRTVEVFKSKG